MAEQLSLDEAPIAPPPAPDPWPAMRAAYPGKPLARRIFVDILEQEWLALEGDLATLYDGATMFLYSVREARDLTPDDHARIIDQCNRLWHERRT